MSPVPLRSHALVLRTALSHHEVLADLELALQTQLLPPSAEIPDMPYHTCLL